MEVVISQKVLDIVELYIRKYRTYYQGLFEDSGIWSSEKIIHSYQKESIHRYKEILLGIQEKLCHPIISYSNNIAIIRWRTKILTVSFKDSGNIRIITDLEIK